MLCMPGPLTSGQRLRNIQTQRLPLRAGLSQLCVDGQPLCSNPLQTQGRRSLASRARICSTSEWAVSYERDRSRPSSHRHSDLVGGGLFLLGAARHARRPATGEGGLTPDYCEQAGGRFNRINWSTPFVRVATFEGFVSISCITQRDAEDRRPMRPACRTLSSVAGRDLAVPPGRETATSRPTRRTARGRSGHSPRERLCINIRDRPLTRWTIPRALTKQSPVDNRTPSRSFCVVHGSAV